MTDTRTLKFRAWDGKKMRNVFFVGDSPKANDCSFDDIIVDNLPLMQFTGLKDKQDVEIYEGDVVKGRYCAETVKMQDGQFYPFGTSYDCLDGTCEPFYPEHCEVIGNIHQNKNLLDA